MSSVNLIAKEVQGRDTAARRAGMKAATARGIRSALLVSLLYDKTPAVRLNALAGLAPYVGQDQRVRDAVLETLMRDSSSNVRSAALGLLQPVQSDSSVRQVLRTVSTQDDNQYIRTASYQALQGRGRYPVGGPDRERGLGAGFWSWNRGVGGTRLGPERRASRRIKRETEQGSVEMNLVRRAVFDGWLWSD